MIFIFIAKIAIFSHFFGPCTCTNTLLYVIINLAGLHGSILASKIVLQLGIPDKGRPIKGLVVYWMLINLISLG